MVPTQRAHAQAPLESKSTHAIENISQHQEQFEFDKWTNVLQKRV
jgi:hypothetical protein